MKKLILSILLISFLTLSFGQKVKFKKGSIKVDGAEWGLYETITFGSKYSYSTLEGEEYLVMSFEKVNTGEYWDNGKEKFDAYIVVKFLGKGIEKFEMDGTRKSLVRALIKSNVIVDGKFNMENALKFKEKHEESISSRYKRGTTIIINN